MISRLRDMLDEGQVAHACWCAMRDPQLAGHIAKQDFDVVVLDGQHGFHEESSILNCIPPVVNAGKSPLVRIPVDRWDMVQKVLDFGALGVIAPMVNNRQDAEKFAESAKFPPTGARSFGPRYAAAMYGLTVNDYVRETTRNTLALAQIETREAYENLDDILSVSGIDGILMGPADFSIFMTGESIPDPYGEATIKAVEDIAVRTRQAGKIAAAFTLSAKHTNIVKSFGYQLISIATDSALVEAGTAKFFQDLKG